VSDSIDAAELQQPFYTLFTQTAQLQGFDSFHNSHNFTWLSLNVLCAVTVTVTYFFYK